MLICEDNWYTDVFYEGELFAALQPKRMICKNEDGTLVESEPSPRAMEFVLTMILQLYLGSIIIMFILYRSCSRKQTDAFRLIFIYLGATVCVALSMNYPFGVSAGGFTRVIAYGVMVHNMAEWFIISRIWFGCATVNALPALCYLISFVIMITVSPLVVLWFIGMLYIIYHIYRIINNVNMNHSVFILSPQKQECFKGDLLIIYWYILHCL